MNGMACVHDDTNWRAAADVVKLRDSVIFGKQATAPHDLQVLPNRIRALIFRAQRCLTALETDRVS
jgi:hypothetical protein